MPKRAKKLQPAQPRPNANQRGYDYQWSKLAKIKLDSDPLCELCLPKTTAAELVHHIVSIQDDPSRRLDYDNLLSVCRKCHGEAHS